MWISPPHPLQPSSPGSAMASWHQASGSSPSCRVIWVGRPPTVSADPSVAPTREWSAPSPTGEGRLLPHPVTPPRVNVARTPHSSPTGSCLTFTCECPPSTHPIPTSWALDPPEGVAQGRAVGPHLFQSNFSTKMRVSVPAPPPAWPCPCPSDLIFALRPAPHLQA